MRYLLIGKGSIGKTLLSIIKNLGEEYDIVECDLKQDGISGEEYILNNHNKIDAVLNLTDLDTETFIDLCDRFDLAYLDAGFECEGDCHKGYIDLLEKKHNGRHLFGFGMNPGIVEYMLSTYETDKKFLAIEFETDTAYVNNKDMKDTFTTWCPYVFYDEELLSEAYAVGKNGVKIHIDNNNRYENEITNIFGTFKYNVTPHEEIYALVKSNPLCMGSMFLYHTPKSFQKFINENIGAEEKTREEISKIKVLDDICGDDKVGVVIYDGSDNVKYIYNKADHTESFNKLGHNGTCWQTACGVYIGMNLMRFVERGESLNFAKASKKYKSMIAKMLDKLQFKIDVIDHFIKKDEFDNKILPIFGYKNEKEWYQ